jgi:hypothetical protein
MFDEDEDCLPELMTEIVPEDGCLAVLDTGDRSTIALTREGIGSLKQRKRGFVPVLQGLMAIG